jgi:hypothetical protein
MNIQLKPILLIKLFFLGLIICSSFFYVLSSKAVLQSSNSLPAYLFSSGASDPLSIYDSASLSGAVSPKTKADQDKIFLIIEKSYEEYFKANPGKSLGIDLYKYIEKDLAKAKVLTYQPTIDKSLASKSVVISPKRTGSQTQTIAKPSVLQSQQSSVGSTSDISPIVAVVAPTPKLSPRLDFKTKLFTSVAEAKVSSPSAIYNILAKNNFLTKSGMASRKAVTTEINNITKPELKKGQVNLLDSSAQEIFVKLQAQGYLKKE